MESFNSLSAVNRVLASVPGNAWSVSVTDSGSEVVAVVDSFNGQRIMIANRVGKRFAVRVENYPHVGGQRKRLGAVVDFSASPQWVEDWVRLAHDRALKNRAA
jgi:hypothetical protein